MIKCQPWLAGPCEQPAEMRELLRGTTRCRIGAETVFGVGTSWFSAQKAER